MPDMISGEKTISANRRAGHIGLVLAPIIGSERDRDVIDRAIETARPFAAHVQCLFVHPDPRLAVPYMAEPLSPSLIEEVIRLAHDGVAQARNAAKASIAAAALAAATGVVDTPGASDDVTISMREVAGDFALSVARAASLSDLVVFGSLSPNPWPDVRQGCIEVLLDAGRPVLIAPNEVKCGGRITVGWDGSFSAARALVASLPFLERARAIEIVHIAAEPQKGPAPQEIEDGLSARGLRFTYREAARGVRSVGEALLAAAHDNDAQLLVMGGYGHSRLRESILGGASRHVVWNTSMPVLLTH